MTSRGAGRRGLPPGVQPALFEERARAWAASGQPLAARMRPRTLEEFVGQEAVLGPGTPLRLMIERDEVFSLVLWGPPGSGKTTIAALMAAHTSRHFADISAVSSGVAEVRAVVADARERLRIVGRGTILFIDEIHRFNRAQQDVVLPHVEEGTIVLVGATTENPSFHVVAPLLSRARVFRLELLGAPEIEAILRRALADEERGLGRVAVAIGEETIAAIVEIAAGDARAALNVLDLAVAAAPEEEGRRLVSRPLVESAAQHRTLLYDRAGDAHYDTISAFIKTVRDSDPDGALYWLARMLEAGEDPLFVVRRLVILAAEDVGLADPRALSLAVACQQAVHFLGMPEAALPLAEATVYLARAPKSNSAYRAYLGAAEDARRTRNEPVPLHLRNAATSLMDEFGYGRGYQYAHDHEGHRPPDQAHRPPSVEGRVYYEPGELGEEAR